MSSTRLASLTVTALLGVFASSPLFAQRPEIPLTNWTVPPYVHSGANAIRPMADVTPGMGFVGVDPCRLVDTRQAGFPAGYGTPALAGGVPRNFDLNSQPNCPGIPAGVEAYSLNFTVTNTAGPGFILIFPQGGTQPGVSTLNYVAGDTLANAAIVPAGTDGGVTVVAGVSGTDLIIDINGYFTDTYNADVSFIASGNTTSLSGVGRFENTNASDSLTYGITATTSSTGENSAGTAAVFGQALGTGKVGATFGGKFTTASTDPDSAGVKGVNGYGDPLGDTLDCQEGCFTAGVRGVGNDAIGVLGISRNTGGIGGGVGVSGVLLEASGKLEAALGHLGVSFGTDPDPGTDFPWAVFGDGDIGATGVKHFVEPHPSDPSLVIKYTSLEGPEAGTYFRGRGKFERGTATIEVPEDFRLVTAVEGLTIQVTPIGQMATVAVRQINLDRIVVQGSRNVEFFYLVHGVRRTFRDLKPIQRGGEFVPRKAGAKMPGYLNEEQKRLLISNGTYREDGAVNLETARRLGWDKTWERNPQSKRIREGSAE